MPAHFYNTNHLTGDALKSRIAKAKSCYLAIKTLFENNPDKQWGASKVHKLMLRAGKVWDLNTVRARMTELKNDHILIMHEDLHVKSEKEGGDPEHPYQLNARKYPTPQDTTQSNLF